MAESRTSNVVTVMVGGGEYWKKVVERMTELTKAGTLKWDVVDAAEAQVSSSRTVHAAYDARYGGRIARFLETEPAPTRSETPARTLGRPLTLREALDLPTTKHVLSRYSLLLVDANGSPLFAFPQEAGSVELLAAIKSQVADVEGFVQALFAAA